MFKLISNVLILHFNLCLTFEALLTGISFERKIRSDSFDLVNEIYTPGNFREVDYHWVFVQMTLN